jgi:coenzyme PQQ synthesis protein D (PqqD)
MPTRKPKVRSDLTVVELEGEAVIYDDTIRQVHYLNRTATIVFNLCDGTSTIRELSGDIADAFSLRSEEVEGQVRTLIRSFREAGFLDEPAAQKEKRTTSSNGKVSSTGRLKGTAPLRKRGRGSRTRKG